MGISRGTWASWRSTAAAVAVAGLGLAVPVAGEAAGTGQNGYTASNYSTGYPNTGTNGIGPIGVAFDASGSLYVTDYQNGGLYVVPPGGGSGVLLQTNYIFGLTESKSGRLYGDTLGGSVVELDKTTGAVSRTVISVLGNAEGIATDPLSGDLFFSTSGGSAIDRISHVEDGNPPTLSSYVPGFSPDGLSFGSDGTLFAAVTSGNSIYSVTGTNQPQPATASVFATLPVPDGTAVSVATVNGALVVNRNDGIITAVDLATKAMTDIVINGSRGDFVTVGPDHCLYATQTDLIEKVTNTDGSCSFVPPPVIPEASTPTLLPLTGVGVLFAVVWNRRRRARAQQASSPTS